MVDIAHLPNRAVLELSGEDRVPFLQGLVSNDVTAAAPGHAVWTGLLTPQGKWLADFFVFQTPDSFLLDVEAGQRDMIAALLNRYRLRAKVALAPSPLRVFAGWDDAPLPTGLAQPNLASPDPRLPEAGWRALAGDLETTATETDYDRHRLQLGLPDGSRDLESDRSTLVEAGFDELHGIGWEKGCYMGQELTARTKYRGLVKRRFVRVRVTGPMPAPGTPILSADTEVGTMRSGRDGTGLALLRLESIRADTLACGDAVLRPDPAPWMRWEPVRLATA